MVKFGVWLFKELRRDFIRNHGYHREGFLTGVLDIWASIWHDEGGVSYQTIPRTSRSARSLWCAAL